ncbi:MAG: DNA polymerase IV [Steroidobacteraceae bacterium]
MLPRTILHVDMDAFYASVEQRDDPSLRGKPVIVGGTGNRGVVAAASYEVRRYGVHSAMPMRAALQRCPHAICLAPRFSLYQAISAQVFAIFRTYTPLVEGLSLDEAFLDVTASRTVLGDGPAIAQSIKQRIANETQLTASVGVAPNKLVAKIASDLRKPDGLVVVGADEIEALLDPLPARRLFGVGNKTGAQLDQIGIHTLRDLRLASDSVLRPVLGRFAAHMRARAAGIDDRPVVADAEEKQISSEETFDTDIADPARLRAEITALADRTAARVRKRELVSGRLTVKIRRADFRTFTRQCVLRPATHDTAIIARSAEQLLTRWLQEHPGTRIRLLGVGAGNLSALPQLDLFTAPQPSENARLDAILDLIRNKYGTRSVTRATELGREREAKEPPRR